MKTRFLAHGLLIFTLGATQGIAQNSIPDLDEQDFDRLHALIQPCPGESPWREIDWETNVTEARRRAVEEDKPLVIFTAADGSPLGRT